MNEEDNINQEVHFLVAVVAVNQTVVFHGGHSVIFDFILELIQTA